MTKIIEIERLVIDIEAAQVSAWEDHDTKLKNSHNSKILRKQQ
jgi:hypothetical protein